VMAQLPPSHAPSLPNPISMLANSLNAGPMKRVPNATTCITMKKRIASPVTARPPMAARSNDPRSNVSPCRYPERVLCTLSGVAILAPHAHVSKTASRAASEISAPFFFMRFSSACLRSSPPTGAPDASVGHPPHFALRMLTLNAFLGSHVGGVELTPGCLVDGRLFQSARESAFLMRPKFLKSFFQFNFRFRCKLKK